MNREIDLPQNKVLFFDLDKTLIDESYQIQNPDVIKSMEELQRRGWILGLNSDTPISALKKWSELFGLEGPIIAEKGGIIMFDKHIYFDQQLQQEFEKSRENIITAAKNIPNIFVWEGDQVELLKQKEKLPQAALSTAILISNLRLLGISFHIRKVDANGNLINDKEKFREITNILHSSYPNIENLEIDENPEYGIVILSSSRNSKREGVKKVMELASWINVGMVGDSITDYLGHDIATQYAVANSSDEYKQKSNFLATQPYTNGVKEICDLIIRNSR